jgi:hypothetical protein
MRVINTKSLEFEELDPKSTEYAVLSHRFITDQEINHQEFLKVLKKGDKRLQRLQSPQTMKNESPGLSKIAWSCFKAKEENIHYMWIDT